MLLDILLFDAISKILIAILEKGLILIFLSLSSVHKHICLVEFHSLCNFGKILFNHQLYVFIGSFRKRYSFLRYVCKFEVQREVAPNRQLGSGREI